MGACRGDGVGINISGIEQVLCDEFRVSHCVSLGWLRLPEGSDNYMGTNVFLTPSEGLRIQGEQSGSLTSPPSRPW